MNLRFIRIWLGEQRLDAVFEQIVHYGETDGAERRRIVRYRWKSKERIDTPPSDWYEVVMKEIEFTNSQNIRQLAREY